MKSVIPAAAALLAALSLSRAEAQGYGSAAAAPSPPKCDAALPEPFDGALFAGMRTRAALEDVLQAAGHQVHCTPRKFDRFCRVVATCTTRGPAGGADLTLERLRAGLGYGFWLSDAAPDDGAGLAYAAAEAEARKQRRGLWKEWLGEK